MKASDFETAGKRLYGRHGWKTELAGVLGIDRVTIWRYATGKREIPEVVKLSMEALEARRVKG